jgi:hypothetical protein
VEAEEDALYDRCSTEHYFDKENLPAPALRGWVSGRYTKRELPLPAANTNRDE